MVKIRTIEDAQVCLKVLEIIDDEQLRCDFVHLISAGYARHDWYYRDGDDSVIFGKSSDYRAAKEVIRLLCHGNREDVLLAFLNCFSGVAKELYDADAEVARSMTCVWQKSLLERREYRSYVKRFGSSAVIREQILRHSDEDGLKELIRRNPRDGEAVAALLLNCGYDTYGTFQDLLNEFGPHPDVRRKIANKSCSWGCLNYMRDIEFSKEVFDKWLSRNPPPSDLLKFLKTVGWRESVANLVRAHGTEKQIAQLERIAKTPVKKSNRKVWPGTAEAPKRRTSARKKKKAARLKCASA